MEYLKYKKEHINYVDGWCTEEKADYLYNLVKEIKTSTDPLVVEIGVYGGKSLFPMALALQENKSGRVIGIDPWQKASNIEGSLSQADIDWWSALDIDFIYKKFVSNTLHLDLLKHLSWFRLRSDEAVKIFEEESIDILHQDGNHSPEVSYKEISIWYPKLKSGGIWVIDDINWPTTKNAVDWLSSNMELIHMTDSWAVYKKK